MKLYYIFKIFINLTVLVALTVSIFTLKKDKKDLFNYYEKIHNSMMDNFSDKNSENNYSLKMEKRYAFIKSWNKKIDSNFMIVYFFLGLIYFFIIWLIINDYKELRGII